MVDSLYSATKSWGLISLEEWLDYSELPEYLVIMYFSDYGFSLGSHNWAKKYKVVPK